MKKTLFALAVALFCTTATTQAQNPNPGYNNGLGYYDDVYQNQNRYYGDDRDPWYDGRQHYDSRQYSRRWVVVAPPRRNSYGRGHWVYAPFPPQRYYAPPAVVYRPRYNRPRPVFSFRGRW